MYTSTVTWLHSESESAGEVDGVDEDEDDDDTSDACATDVSHPHHKSCGSEWVVVMPSVCSNVTGDNKVYSALSAGNINASRACELSMHLL